MDVKKIQPRINLKPILKSKLFTITLVMFSMIVIASLVSQYFLTPYNLQSLARDLAFIGIITILQSCLLIMGELDLSVGKIAALCGILSGMLMVHSKVNPIAAIALCIALGAFFGAINGLIITKLKLSAMIVTIGMTGVYGGINVVLTQGRAITGIPKSIHFLGSGTVFGIPVPFIFLLIVLVSITYMMRNTRLGRYIYAIGNNREAAKIIGIQTDRIRITVFSLMGAFAAFTGLLMVARLGTAQPTIGDTWPLNSIAASVIGGVLLTGGDGSPIGALIGATIISLIQNMIVLFGISIYWQATVSGLVVVIAISIDPLVKIFKEYQKRISKRDKSVVPTSVSDD